MPVNFETNLLNNIQIGIKAENKTTCFYCGDPVEIEEITCIITSDEGKQKIFHQPQCILSSLELTRQYLTYTISKVKKFE